ncbi:GNAT family N-acetyltransferase [Vibrio parahaemolyticus]|nr:GNAT family N-acetyltransferase [Vibrio parahaemolyticus]
MVSLRKLSDFSEKSEFKDYIDGINVFRSYYQWSQKNYDVSNIKDVYLIRYINNIVGFIEASYNNLEIDTKNPVTLFLHELHISPKMQGKGIGEATLNLLLDKNVLIEMVVVNDNKSMLKLVDKLNGESKYITENTRTIQLSRFQ